MASALRGGSITISRPLTLLSTLLVFLTIVAGGLVHATGSGLACPDWPLCFGQYFPAMEGAVLFEHSHRIVAGISGLLVWAAGVAVYFDPRRTRWQRWTIAGLMVLILVQAVLGGLTVLWRLPRWVSLSHFAVAQLTLLGMASLSWSMEPRTGTTRPSARAESLPSDRGDRWLAFGCFVLVALQVFMGGVVRHNGTFGEMVPGLWERGHEGTLPCAEYPLCEPLWLGYMSVRYHLLYGIHRWGGVVVSIVVCTVTWRMWRHRQRQPVWFRLAGIGALAVGVQVLLGELSVRSYLAPVPVTLHLAGGVLLMLAFFFLTLETCTPGLRRNRSRTE